jgi:hypothetical protein
VVRINYNNIRYWLDNTVYDSGIVKIGYASGNHFIVPLLIKKLLFKNKHCEYNRKSCIPLSEQISQRNVTYTLKKGIMIKINYNLDGKVTKLTFKHNQFKIIIEPYVFCIKRSKESNIGNIIENYRKKIDNSELISAQNYWDSKIDVINSFVKNSYNPFNKYQPDYISIFYPNDRNRKKLLFNFAKAVKINSDFDFSDYFSKIDYSKSVVKDKNYEQNFKYSKPNNLLSCTKILIIDDTIDEGRTLDVFLNKLFENSLINFNTEIKFICIYNNPKFDDKIKNIDLKKLMK